MVYAGVDHRAYRKALGINTVPTAGDHLFARLHLLVGHDVTDKKLSLVRALDDSLQPRPLQDHARAAVLVIDHQHLRAERKNFLHLAHDAVRSDDRHICLDAGAVTFIDLDDVRLLAAAAADDLGNYAL